MNKKTWLEKEEDCLKVRMKKREAITALSGSPTCRTKQKTFMQKLDSLKEENIFPNYKLGYDYLFSYVRIEDNGKYYLHLMKRSTSGTRISDKEYQAFIRECYFTIFLSKAPKNPHEEYFFEDVQTITERERLALKLRCIEKLSCSDSEIRMIIEKEFGENIKK
ncbi:hypothetical protein LCGC14_2169530 [marine sediment metagenome]|uniref:Uncharacterized protein n=1 Tax=marine sediment metagenome TaxID=412755 RepID=A0A0F9G350_9ZZZZ